MIKSLACGKMKSIVLSSSALVKTLIVQMSPNAPSVGSSLIMFYGPIWVISDQNLWIHYGLKAAGPIMGSAHKAIVQALWTHYAFSPYTEKVSFSP
jgi:hypothetical protein